MTNTNATAARTSSAPAAWERRDAELDRRARYTAAHRGCVRRWCATTQEYVRMHVCGD